MGDTIRDLVFLANAMYKRIHREESTLPGERLLDLDMVGANSKITRSDDLLWLLKKWPDGKYTRRTVILDKEEMELLFNTVKLLPEKSNILEIGRLLGGSTIVLGTGMGKDSHLTSIDNILRGCDKTLEKALEILGIRDHVTLITADANSVDSLFDYYDLIFIDGDHSYNGVSRDYNKWKYSVRRGGHLLFHDAFLPSAPTPAECGYGTYLLIDEIIHNESKWFKLTETVNTLAHFTRMEKDWDE